MRITREGWARNCGETELFKQKISDGRLVEEDTSIGYDELVVHRWEVAEGRPGAGTVQLKFRIDAKTQPMNGHFLLRLTFSRKDIALLAQQSLKSATGEVAFAALAGK